MSNYIVHSAKGTTWSKKDHKYIKKDGKRYIYDKVASIKKKAKSAAIDASFKINDVKDSAADKAHIVADVATNLPRDLYSIFTSYVNDKHDEYIDRKKRKVIEKEMQKKIDKGYAFVYDQIYKTKAK